MRAHPPTSSVQQALLQPIMQTSGDYANDYGAGGSGGGSDGGSGSGSSGAGDAGGLSLRKYWAPPQLLQDWNDEQEDRNSTWTEVGKGQSVFSRLPPCRPARGALLEHMTQGLQPPLNADTLAALKAQPTHTHAPCNTILAASASALLRPVPGGGRVCGRQDICGGPHVAGGGALPALPGAVPLHVDLVHSALRCNALC